MVGKFRPSGSEFLSRLHTNADFLLEVSESGDSISIQKNLDDNYIFLLDP
jgi:hypothetical protein